MAMPIPRNNKASRVEAKLLLCVLYEETRYISTIMSGVEVLCPGANDETGHPLTWRKVKSQFWVVYMFRTFAFAVAR
jgi:hypothetical protein